MRKIICGDCAEALKKLDDNSVDAVVTDPPYGLGNHEPTIEEIIFFLQGDGLNTGGDFMGQKWNIPSVKVWTEIFRVLKPGGHVLSFGGTRSWDLISLGLRAAGFESRDTIASDFPGLRWAYGQGFPKSHDVSKAIDKLAGAEREVEDWDGWGTALKPSWEPILVFRKPFEGTVAKNVLQHGCGGLNIDGCRVGYMNDSDQQSAFPGGETTSRKVTGGGLGCGWKEHDRGNFTATPPTGRWPTNSTLTHHPDCKQVGTKKVKGSHDTTGIWGKDNFGFGFGYDKDEKVQGFTSKDGTETVEAWECVPGCPVKALDEQSGTVDSRPGSLCTTKSTSKGYQPNAFGQESRPEGSIHPRYHDSGTASRFFPSFQGQEPVDVPFKYVTKPRKSETTLDGRIENKHPTKKPLELMRWLVRLVCPKGGTVLDPYCGSATTLAAARLEGMNYVGIERDEGFYDIAKARMNIIDQETADVEHGRNIYDMLLDMDDDG